MAISIARMVDYGTTKLQEVIVTAQKRPENVNTVPIVISVLTNDEFIQDGINSNQQLETATPGLAFGNTRRPAAFFCFCASVHYGGARHISG
jgi:outer membrane receptor protein involved in Fe transport